MKVLIRSASACAIREVPIEEVIEMNDEVLADNGIWKPVLRVFDQGVKPTYCVTILRDCYPHDIICTPDHKFAVYNKYVCNGSIKVSNEWQWKQAIELKECDCLVGIAMFPERFLYTNDFIKVERVKPYKDMRTYDLEVKDLHQFTVENVLVHNSALISLSNPSDDRMRTAKSGTWWIEKPFLSNANNSACYSTEKIDMDIFFPEWKSLYDSKSGERGIFNRAAAVKHLRNNNERRLKLNQVPRLVKFEFGTNPCSEILLRPFQMCNLTEVVCRPDDTFERLKEKIKFATIMGTYQSALTNFKYLRAVWRKTCEEERLLGVSLTGIMDCPLLNNTEPGLEERLEELKKYAVHVNHKYAAKLGINPSTSVTCVKPSGTVSQLVNAASGIHPRHSKYYIRRVRCDKKDPLYQCLKDQGVPVEQDVYKEEQAVFSFIIKSPEGTITRDQLNALDHLELWKIYAKYYCEHKPSITVSVREEEWLKVGAWVFDNFDIVSGISFLPYSDSSYQQMPYEEIDEKTYNDLFEKKYKDLTIDWTKLGEYEHEDRTKHAQNYACTGDKCEVVDLI